MDPEDIVTLVRGSIVTIEIHGRRKRYRKPVKLKGIIIACKPHSAYIIVDARDVHGFVHSNILDVHFPDGSKATPKKSDCRVYNGILGILCCLNEVSFDPSRVYAIQICHQELQPLNTVYFYQNIDGHISDGSVTQIDAQYFSLTAIGDGFAEYGAPVLNENGMLVGISWTFEYHITARSILSIADAIERSQNRPFMSVSATLNHLLDNMP